MRLELIEKLADENLAEIHVARLVTTAGVKLVTARRLQRQVSAHQELLEGLRRVGEQVCSLQHPNLLSTLGPFEADGSLWWLSDRTEGFDLATVFQRIASREVRSTAMRSLQIGVDFLEGLAALHEADQVHGGIGPRQVLVGLDGVSRLDGLGYEQVLMGIREFRQKVRRGRRGHLAPEVMQGRPPAKNSDVFSAAAIVYQLLTGRPPLEEAQRGMSTRHQAVQPPSKLDRSLPYSCDAVFVKALAVGPGARHDDGPALRNAVSRLRKSLVQAADEGRAGVVEFISNLYPNEAKVAGMPGTLERPARGDPLELTPLAETTERVSVALGSAAPAAGVGFEGRFYAGPGTEPRVAPGTQTNTAPETQPLAPAAAPATVEEPFDPGGPGSITEVVLQQRPTAGDWEGAGEPTPAVEVVRPLQEYAATTDTAPAQDSAASAARLRSDTAVVPMADLGGVSVPEASSSAPVPMRPPERGSPAGGFAAPLRVPAWKRPAFLLAAGFTGLVLVALFALASGWLSTTPTVGPIGPPSEQTTLIGFLSVESDVPARITLDGEVLPGKAPLANKLVRAGRHRLVVHSLLGEVLFDQIVEVPAGQHKQVQVALAAGQPGPIAPPPDPGTEPPSPAPPVTSPVKNTAVRKKSRKQPPTKTRKKTRKRNRRSQPPVRRKR